MFDVSQRTVLHEGVPMYFYQILTKGSKRLLSVIQKRRLVSIGFISSLFVDIVLQTLFISRCLQ